MARPTVFAAGLGAAAATAAALAAAVVAVTKTRKTSIRNPQPYTIVQIAGFWSTILEYFFLVPGPLRNHYEIKAYTFFSLVTSKSK